MTLLISLLASTAVLTTAQPITGVVNAGPSKIFYAYEPAVVSTQNVILSIGSACSSMLNIVAGFGSWRVSPNLRVYPNPYSWTKFAHLVHIDVPAEVGFSKNDSAVSFSDEVVATTIVSFWQSYIQMATLPRGAKTYIAGAGYAGHYAPLVIAMAPDLFAGSILAHPLTDLDSFARHAVQAVMTTSIVDASANAPNLTACGDEIVNFYVGASANPSTTRCIDARSHAFYSKQLSSLSSSLYSDACGPNALPTPDGVFDPCAVSNAIDFLSSAIGQTWFGVTSPAGNPVPFKPCNDLVWLKIPEGDIRRSMAGYYNGSNRATSNTAENSAATSARSSQASRHRFQALRGEGTTVNGNEDVNHALLADGFASLLGAEIGVDTRTTSSHTAAAAAAAGSSPHRHLLYTGNAAVIPPFTSLVDWVAETVVVNQPPEQNEWLELYYNTNDCQLAGYAASYSHNITIASIRGSGYNVAIDQPGRLFQMVSLWLGGDAKVGGVLAPTIPTSCGAAPGSLEAAAFAQHHAEAAAKDSSSANGNAHLFTSTSTSTDGAASASQSTRSGRVLSAPHTLITSTMDAAARHAVGVAAGTSTRDPSTPRGELLAREHPHLAAAAAAAMADVVASLPTEVPVPSTPVSQAIPLNLPNSQPIPNQQYSGYVHVGGTDGVDGRHIFFWVTEATPSAVRRVAKEREAAAAAANASGAAAAAGVSSSKGSKNAPFAKLDDLDNMPVLLWLQGGPGCSGLLGLFTEFGPLQAGQSDPNNNQSTYLYPRTVAWTSFAHIVTVESPVCVGFSYLSGNQAICTQLNDTITSHDSLNFILGLYAQFPNLATRPLYIAGESYAGHYVPQLSVRVLEYNQASLEERKAMLDGDAALAWSGAARSEGAAAADGRSAATQAPTIPLVGAIDGNPVTDITIGPARDFLRWANTPILPPRIVAGIAQYCTPAMLSGFQAGDCNMGSCTEKEKKIYGISDACWPWIRLVTPGPGLPGNIDFANPNTDQCPTVHPDYQGSANSPFDPCGLPSITNYLNRMDVQNAIGVRNLGTAWGECSDPVNLGYSFNDTFTSMIPLWIQISQNASVLIYSGDSDEIVTSIGTATWTGPLLDAQSAGFRELWYDQTNDLQIAGWMRTSKNFSFATVRNAGHTVPSYQALRIQTLVGAFIQQQLPSLIIGNVTVSNVYPYPGAPVFEFR